MFVHDRILAIGQCKNTKLEELEIRTMACHDKNSRELKIGELVITRRNKLGTIIQQEGGTTGNFFLIHHLNKSAEYDYYYLPESLTVVTQEEATLWLLEN